jgi:hypothetical protein
MVAEESSDLEDILRFNGYCGWFLTIVDNITGK